MAQTGTYTISPRASQRLDLAKLWFSFMVVFIHANQEGVNLVGGNIVFETPAWLALIKRLGSDIIPRCAVPGFFLIAGVLLFRKPFSWKENMRKKCRSLAVPYLLLNTLWILFYLVCQSLPVVSGFFTQNPIAAWEWLDWLDAYTGFRAGGPMVYHLWFLRDLFLMNLIAPAIGWVTKRRLRLLQLWCWHCICCGRRPVTLGSPLRPSASLPWGAAWFPGMCTWTA